MENIKKLFLDGRIEKFKEAVKYSNYELLKELVKALEGKELNLQTLKKLEKNYQNDSENLSWIGLIYTISNNLEKAKEILEKATNLKNVSPYAFFRLANLFILEGNLEKAKDLMLKGLKLEEIAEAYYNLAYIYSQLGEKEKAIKSYKKALELKPFSVGVIKKLMSNLDEEEIDKFEKEIEEKLDNSTSTKDQAKYLAILGILKYLKKEFNDGILKLTRAINLYEEDEELRTLYIEFMLKENRYWILGNKLVDWVNKYDKINEHLALARCRIEAGFLEKAKEGLDKIKDKISSEILDYKLILADYYMENNEYDKAKEILEELFREYSNYPPVIVALSDLYKQLGDLDKSLELLENGDALNLLMRKMDLKNVEEKEVQRLEEFFEKTEDDDLKANIAFSLADGFDKIKDYKKASFYIKKANELTYKKLDYSIEDFRKEVDTLIDSFSKEWVKTHQNDIPFDKRPIFIVGMPRSGTTMLEQIFAAHNQVFGAGELPFIPKIISLSEKITKKNYPFSFVESDKDFVTQAGAYYIKLVKKMYNFNEPIFVDKLPHNFLHSPLLVAMFANSRVIALRRDYRSIALSNYFQNFSAKRGKLGYSFDLKAMGEHIKDYIRIMKYYKSILPENRYKEFWYEDLVLNPKEKIPEVLKFCDLEFTPEVLEFYKNKTAVKTASVTQVRNPIYTKSIEKWKNYEDLLKPVIEIVGEEGIYNV